MSKQPTEKHPCLFRLSKDCRDKLKELSESYNFSISTSHKDKSKNLNYTIYQMDENDINAFLKKSDLQEIKNINNSILYFKLKIKDLESKKESLHTRIK